MVSQEDDDILTSILSNECSVDPSLYDDNYCSLQTIPPPKSIPKALTQSYPET